MRYLWFWLFFGWFPLFWFWTPAAVDNRGFSRGRADDVGGGLAFILLLTLFFFPFYEMWILFYLFFIFYIIIYMAGAVKIRYFEPEAKSRRDNVIDKKDRKMDLTPSTSLKSVQMQL